MDSPRTSLGSRGSPARSRYPRRLLLAAIAYIYIILPYITHYSYLLARMTRSRDRKCVKSDMQESRGALLQPLEILLFYSSPNAPL